jgi:rhomboid protease GluP
MSAVFQRRTTGSVVCPSCGSLVGVRDDKCYTCGRSNPGLWGFGPALRQIGINLGFAPIVVGACVALWLITLLLSGGGGGGNGGIMFALSPSPTILLLFGESGYYPIFVYGRWWTVLSAGWLHGGALHILMNMYWVWQMGPSMADLLGPARTVIIYTVGGVTGFALSSFAGAFLPALPFLRGAAFTVGASASVFGLIGALYHYGRTSSIARQQANFIIVQAVMFGVLFGPNSGIDNYAHLGGFAGGYLTSAFLNPLTRERGDHVIIAVACLAASAVAVIASIVTGLSLIAR